MQTFLDSILSRRWESARVVHHAVLPETEAKYGFLDPPLNDKLDRALKKRGIRGLYAYQAEAVEHVRAGRDVVVTAPTAAGKSLVYNLSVIESLMIDPRRHALYLFPLKALGRDQMEALLPLLQDLPSDTSFTAAVYDGDTTPYQRSKIRGHPPHILLTNPDMLHYGLLAYHSAWESFWKRLRFVVVDEVHTYRGVFGSHVAQILWRLQRVCRLYGGDPQFILLSATIGNPRQLSESIVRRPVALVKEDSVSRSRRHFIFFEMETSGAQLAARLLAQAVERGIKTIVFTRSRRQTELTHMSLQRMAPGIVHRVSSYRAGFLPEERRAIERQLSAGKLGGVVSTSALELGVDIGGLDLCILLGYPGTVMSTWQRGGRVGRGSRESAIVLLPQPDALDQYIVRHPRELLRSDYEPAIVDPCNSEILKAHLPCAAAEAPLRRRELSMGEQDLTPVVDELARKGRLFQTAGGDRWVCREKRPHRLVDIRTAGPSYSIFTLSADDRWTPLGKSDGLRALKECHQGAVYLHRGQTFVVKELDLKKRIVRAAREKVSYFTRVKTEKETEILEVLASKPAGNFLVRLGRLRVTEFITGYDRRRLFSQELLDSNPLDLPPQVFETVGFWLEMDNVLARKIGQSNLHFMGGIHAVEHALISMFPLFALCDRNDLGGISQTLHPRVGKSAVFVYDGYPGGIGLAARGYEMILPLLEKTRELVRSCPCLEGCPACIHSPKCGSGNKPLDKLAAQAVLSYLLGEWMPEPEGTPTDSREREEDFEKEEPAPEPTFRVGVLDLETQRLASEVGGWRNKHLMRVSVAVLYDSLEDRFETYREEDLDALFRRLRELDLVVGFNIKRFDYPVLNAYTPLDLQSLPTVDLLELVHKQAGFRLSLDHLAEVNLDRSKSADGLQAVRWYREQKWEPLMEYCREDVAITRDLFHLVRKNGYLLYRNGDGERLRIPVHLNPDEFSKARSRASLP